MIFSSIKGVTIPEGVVKQIADAAGKILWKPGGVDVASMAIAYSGAFTDQKDVVFSDGKTYRLLTLTGSGTLTLPEEVTADVWLCNGGNCGGMYAGPGGGGGYFVQEQGIALGITTACTIGAGAAENEGTRSPKAGGSTSMGTITPTAQAASANGASGGGSGGYMSSAGSGGGDSTVPFVETTLFDPHSAGGGGGGFTDLAEDKPYGGGAGGTNGANGGTRKSDYETGGAGGTKGGGAGGNGVRSSTATTNNMGNAATYYGSGGGAGGVYYTAAGKEYGGYGGAGYQGVIYVRIPYEQ